jgi:hypothetical protein
MAVDFKQYRADLLAVAYRMLGNPMHADEVEQ